MAPQSLIRVTSGRLVLCLLKPEDLSVLASTTECVALLGHMTRKDLFNMFEERERREIEKIRESAIVGTGPNSRLIKSCRNAFLWFENQTVCQEAMDFLEERRDTMMNISQSQMNSFITDAVNKAAQSQTDNDSGGDSDQGASHDSEKLRQSEDDTKSAPVPLVRGSSSGGGNGEVQTDSDTSVSPPKQNIDMEAVNEMKSAFVSLSVGGDVASVKSGSLDESNSFSPTRDKGRVEHLDVGRESASVFQRSAGVGAGGFPQPALSVAPTNSDNTPDVASPLPVLPRALAHCVGMSSARSTPSPTRSLKSGGASGLGSDMPNMYSVASTAQMESTQSLNFDDVFDEAALEGGSEGRHSGKNASFSMRGGHNGEGDGTRSRFNTGSFDGTYSTGQNTPLEVSPCTMYAQQLVNAKDIYSPSSSLMGGLSGGRTRARVESNASNASVDDNDAWGYFTPGSLSGYNN